jgi:mRNA-degrading endonuclease RelE of RelBE toxin-antitoxin system
MYQVKLNNKTLKGIQKMPKRIQKKMGNLLDELKMKGPIRTEWKNFSKLGENNYHCHLEYKWVACWKIEKNSIIIEVYYAGSRENAPY